MIRPTVVALALCVASAAQSMPYVPLPLDLRRR